MGASWFQARFNAVALLLVLLFFFVKLGNSAPSSLTTPHRQLTDHKTCQAFEELPSECVPYVNYHVYVPDELTQKDMARPLQQDIDKAIRGGLSTTCKKSYIAYLCITTFKQCSYMDEERHVAVEHPICNSFCRQVVKDCLGDLILAHKDVPKCNDTSQFPKDDTVIPYSENNINGTYMCFKPGIDEDWNNGDIVCPRHYQPIPNFDDSKDWAQCKRSCPLEIYSKTEYEALSITQIVFGWVGVAVIIFVLIPFFLNFSDALNYGSFLSLYVMIPTLMVSVALVWPSFFGSYKNVICQKDSIKLADTSSFPCAIQGSLLYWGASSMVVWWVIVCFHLMVGAFYGVIGYSNPVLSKIYHSLGWGLPSIGLSILWIARRVSASVGYTNCFVDMDSAEGWWASGLFFVELTVAIGLAFFFLHIAIFKLISTYGLAGFHRQGRLVIFAYYFMFVSLFIMIYWWVIKGLRSDLDAATDDWFSCLAQRFYDAQNKGAVSNHHDYGCVLSERNPFGLLYAQALIFSSIPFFVAAIFGHSWYTWNMWGTIVCSFCCVFVHTLQDPRSILFMKKEDWLSHSASDLELTTLGKRSSRKDRSAKFALVGSEDEEMSDFYEEESGREDEEGEGRRRRRRRSYSNGSSSGETEMEEAPATDLSEEEEDVEEEEVEEEEEDEEDEESRSGY